MKVYAVILWFILRDSLAPMSIVAGMCFSAPLLVLVLYGPTEAWWWFTLKSGVMFALVSGALLMWNWHRWRFTP